MNTQQIQQVAGKMIERVAQNSVSRVHQEVGLRGVATYGDVTLTRMSDGLYSVSDSERRVRDLTARQVADALLWILGFQPVLPSEVARLGL